MVDVKKLCGWHRTQRSDHLPGLHTNTYTTKTANEGKTLKIFNIVCAVGGFSA